MSKRLIVAFSALVVAGSLALSSPARAEGWECELGFYGWFTGLDGTISAGQVSDAPVSATFSDLASYLDFAMAGYFEAAKPRYIFQTDISYVGLGATREAEIDGAFVDLDLDFSQVIVELGGAYRVKPTFDLWLAGRFYSFDAGASYQGSDVRSGSHSWMDAYVGARYHTTFKKRWIAAVRADIGAGGSDLAWFGNATLGYKCTETFTVAAGYRILSLDREDGTGLDYYQWDVTQDGLGIALSFALR